MHPHAQKKAHELRNHEIESLPSRDHLVSPEEIFLTVNSRSDFIKIQVNPFEISEI